MSAIAVSSIVASVLHVPWRPYTPFLVSLPVAIAVILLRKLWLRRSPAAIEPLAWRWPFIAGVVGIVIGAVLIAIPLKAGIGMPDWPSQTYDGIFHLNAVQQILQTGDASPFRLTVSTPEQASTFYPSVWHATVALIVQMSGATIPVAANAASFAISCVIWPIACVFLARQVFGQDRLALLVAGVFSAAFAAFPLMLVQFGVLYPNLLALALLPIALGALVAAVGKGRDPGLERPGRWLMVFWLVGGMGLAHPNAVFGFMVLGLPLVVQASVEYIRDAARPAQRRIRAWSSLSALGAAIAVSAIMWSLSKTGDNAWQPYQSVPQAIGEALFNGPLVHEPAAAVSVLGIIGIIASLRVIRYLWVSVSYALSIFLFVVASAWLPGDIRTAVTGLWYNDWNRLAAMLPVMAVPLATLGALIVIRRLQRAAANAVQPMPGAPYRPIAIGLVPILALVLLVPLTQDQSIGGAEERLASFYLMSDKSALLTPDEVAVFTIVRGSVPENAVIAGNPWNGSALVYAYTGRKALFPHVGGEYARQRWQIADNLALHADRICTALVDQNVRYVLDFGGGYLFGDDPRSQQYPGFNGLTHSRSVALVAHRGKARLYKITACGLDGPEPATTQEG